MPTRMRLPHLSLALLVGALVLVAAVWSEPAGAQAVPPVEEEEAAERGDEAAAIDEILAGDEEMVAGEGYSYDPGNRRDPFKSLLAARSQARIRGPRPEGIPGLLIDDIDLTGIFVTGEGPVAQILSADKNESFLLRVGDQLYDGDVVSIKQDEIVFRQIVDDPTAIKPFREVVKKLNP